MEALKALVDVPGEGWLGQSCFHRQERAHCVHPWQRRWEGAGFIWPSENCGPLLLASPLWAPWEQCWGLGSAQSIPGQRSSLLGAGKKHPPSIQVCHRNVSPGKGNWKKQRSSLLLQQLVENSVQCSL